MRLIKSVAVPTQWAHSFWTLSHTAALFQKLIRMKSKVSTIAFTWHEILFQTISISFNRGKAPLHHSYRSVHEQKCSLLHRDYVECDYTEVLILATLIKKRRRRSKQQRYNVNPIITSCNVKFLSHLFLITPIILLKFIIIQYILKLSILSQKTIKDY